MPHAPSVLNRAWELLDAGELDAARAEAESVLADAGGELDEHDRAEGRLVIAQLDFIAGERDRAATALAELGPELADDGEVLTDAGNLAFALGDLRLAGRLFDRAVDIDNTIADALYGRGLVAQEVGDFEGQVRWFLATAEADAADPDPPWAMSVDEFAEIAEDVLDMLPREVIDHLENVPIIVESAPTTELIRDGVDPRLLGLFSGIPLTEKSTVEPAGPSLDAIHLFQRNLERHCQSRDELIEEIATTVLHETAHFFGLEDHHLDDLGLG